MVSRHGVVLAARIVLAAGMAASMMANAAANAAASMVANAAANTVAESDHPASRLAIDLPPSAELRYAIKARQSGFSLNGDALISWQVKGGNYTLLAETRALLLGKVMENRSAGAIDDYGLAPSSFYEKRFRKDPSTTTFDRAARTIVFTDSKLRYPLKGGEQDRTSAPWQLVAAARGAPDKFVPGSQWVFFVAGRRDAEPWTFKVVNREKVHTGLGELEAVHLVKAPPPDSRDQRLDIWLAPAQQWYPVRLRFSDAGGEFVDQTLESIGHK